MAETIALVGCVKTKRTSSAAAKDLYISNLFRKSRTYAERFADRWFILSAKYGLLHPNELTEPYEQTLKGAPIATRRAWADRVYLQLQSAGALKEGVAFVWLAGKDYQQPLSELLEHFKQNDPLAGLGMFQRAPWLKQQLAGASQAGASTVAGLSPEAIAGRGTEATRTTFRMASDTGMTREKAIAGFLQQHKQRAFCDDCLSKILRILPRQQVQQKTSRLGQRGGFTRDRGRCSRCSETRKVIQAALE